MDNQDNRDIAKAALVVLAFAWDEQAGHYVDLSTGEFVPIIKARDALESVMGVAKDRMGALTQQLIDGGIPLAEWQAGMMEQIKVAHTASAAAARGGWAQMSQSDWGAAGRMIRTQYDYLRNFSGEIASGKQSLSGQAQVRADLYGGAPRGTFEEINRRYETNQNGAEEECRILGEADHCQGCLDQAELGWQPIGTLDPIGGEECLTRCHCKFIYRKVGPDGEWVVSDGE